MDRHDDPGFQQLLAWCDRRRGGKPGTRMVIRSLDALSLSLAFTAFNEALSAAPAGSALVGSLGQGAAVDDPEAETAPPAGASALEPSLVRSGPVRKAAPIDMPESDGRYSFVHALRGGMGLVYFCYDHQSQFPFVVKTFREDLFLSSPKILPRFMQEIELWMGLGTHPHIVRPYGCRRIGQMPCLFMEFVAGRSLRELIDEEGTLAPADIVELGIMVLSALEHSARKRKGFVHGDLKPSNILVEDGEANVTDFGLARTTTQDSSGTPTGTPLYMSPEQWRAEGLDGKADVYALAAMLVECLTGKPPYEASSVAAIKRAHLEAPLPRLAVPKRWKPLAALLLRCLAKYPAARPSLAEARRTLHRLRAREEVAFMRRAEGRRARLTWLWNEYRKRGGIAAALGLGEAFAVGIDNALRAQLERLPKKLDEPALQRLLALSRLAGDNPAPFRQWSAGRHDLSGIELSGRELLGIQLPRARLAGRRLDGCDLRRAQLRKAQLAEASLADCDLRQAQLEGADLRGARLGGARLGGAVLARAHLEGADLRGCALGHLSLRSCVWDATTLWPEGVDPTTLSGELRGGIRIDAELGAEPGRRLLLLDGPLLGIAWRPGTRPQVHDDDVPEASLAAIRAGLFEPVREHALLCQFDRGRMVVTNRGGRLFRARDGAWTALNEEELRGKLYSRYLLPRAGDRYVACYMLAKPLPDATAAFRPAELVRMLDRLAYPGGSAVAVWDVLDTDQVFRQRPLRGLRPSSLGYGSDGSLWVCDDHGRRLRFLEDAEEESEAPTAAQGVLVTALPGGFLRDVDRVCLVVSYTAEAPSRLALERVPAASPRLPAVSPCGRALALCFGDDRLRVFSLESGEPCFRLDGVELLGPLAVWTDGDEHRVADARGVLFSGIAEEQRVPEASTLTFLPDGTLALLYDRRARVEAHDTGPDRELRVRLVGSAAEPVELPLTLRGSWLAAPPPVCSPDGRWLAGPCREGLVALVDLRNPDASLALPTEGALRGLAFAPDGSRLACLYSEGERERLVEWQLAALEG